MKKRMLAMLLCMAMVLSLLPMAALAAEDDTSTSECVYFLSSWDAATHRVVFDYSKTEISPYTYTVADDVDTSYIDSLVNRYVLATTEQGESVLEYTVTDIQPVESRIGTVTNTSESLYLETITIDGTEYPVTENRYLSYGDMQGNKLLYHLNNNIIVDFDLLEKNSGTLEAWNGKTGIVTIDGKEYPTNYLTDLSFLANIDQTIGTTVDYYVPSYSSTGYTPAFSISTYTTGTGVFSHYDLINNEVYIDDEAYPVDAQQCTPNTAELNGKQVFFLLRDGILIHIGAIENITSSLSLAYSPNPIEFIYKDKNFDQSSIPVEITVQNTIDYNIPYTYASLYDYTPIYADFLDFVGDSCTIYLKSASWDLSSYDNCFHISDIDAAGTVIGPGEKRTATVRVSPASSYSPSGSTQVVPLLTLEAEGNQSRTFEFLVAVKVEESSSESDNEKTDTETTDLSNSASKELSKIDEQIMLDLNAMSTVFGLEGDALTRFKQELLCCTVMSNIPKESFDSKVSDKVLEKIFGKYKSDISGSSYTIPLYYVIDTPKYGKVTVLFQINVTSFDFTKQNIGLFATIGYDIVQQHDKKSTVIPSYLKTNSQLGQITVTKINSFLDAAYDLAEAEIKNAYNIVWGNSANQIAATIFSDTVQKVLNANNSTFKDKLWDLIVWPTKSAEIDCPTNVYVYNSAGQLCGSIENDSVTLQSDDFQLHVEGDSKYIEGLDDNYTIKYVGTATGVMDVRITEFLRYNTPMRVVSFYDVPLTAGVEYIQEIPDGILPLTETYHLISEPDIVIEADKDEYLLVYDTAVPAEFKIVIPTKLENGTITVSSTTATAGSKVTITVTPDTGYQLDKLTAVDASGTAIALTDQGDGTYTFTMPASNVSISASFAALEAPAPVLPFTDVTTSDWFYDAVAYVYDNSLMTGTSATTFSPNATTTRGMIVTILHRLEGSPAAEASGFADVESGAWYQEAVDWAAANGIVNGTSQTTFAPTSPITREQMAAILYRYAAYKGYDVSQLADLNRFSDSSAVSTYAADALAWSNAAGLITGVTDTSLSPQGSAVRAQAATILMRFCENIAQ